MSDDARRIVIQFLRTPHPTARLMKTLTFEQDTLEFDDGSDEDILSVSGHQLRIMCKGTFPSVIYPCMRGRASSGKDFTPRVRYLNPYEDSREFAYNLDGGECRITNCLYHTRMMYFCNMLREERGLPRQICPGYGPPRGVTATPAQ